MPAPQERPWFQFHLSTAVVLMFVAAGLLWVNTVCRDSFRRDNLLFYSEDLVSTYGWPVQMLESTGRHFIVEETDETTTDWSYKGVLINGLTGISILLAVAIGCEWPIRRKQRRTASIVRGSTAFMPAPAKRPWFQFHLSTAVVLMFVAAGLLWLNVHPSPVAPILDPDIDIGLQVDANARPFGWPIIAVYTCGAADTSRVAKIHQSAAAFDLFLALSILLAAGASLEWLIRRKQRRKAEAGRNP